MANVYLKQWGWLSCCQGILDKIEARVTSHHPRKESNGNPVIGNRSKQSILLGIRNCIGFWRVSGLHSSKSVEEEKHTLTIKQRRSPPLLPRQLPLRLEALQVKTFTQ
jgi:hypothetical protein